MVERLLPSDDPVAEEVLEWTIKRDAQDIAQLMEWLVGTTARKEGSGDAHQPCIGSNGRD